MLDTIVRLINEPGVANYIYKDYFSWEKLLLDIIDVLIQLLCL